MLLITMDQATQIQSQQVMPTQVPPGSQVVVKPTKKTSNSSLMLWGCVVVFALFGLSFVGGVFVGRNYFSKNEQQTTTTVETTTVADINNGDPNKVLVISTPSENETVNGRVLVEGRASAIFEELTIKIYDSKWNLLGTTNAGLAGEDVIANWSVFVDIQNSPIAFDGLIRVYPTDDGEDSRRLQTTKIMFETVTEPGRLKLFSPIKLQYTTGTAVYFKGQMKDFPNDTLGIRLVNEQKGKLYEAKIQSGTSTIGQFVQFEQLVELNKNIKESTPNGWWEFYEVDENGKLTNLIMSLLIRFPS